MTCTYAEERGVVPWFSRKDILYASSMAPAWQLLWRSGGFLVHFQHVRRRQQETKA